MWIKVETEKWIREKWMKHSLENLERDLMNGYKFSHVSLFIKSGLCTIQVFQPVSQKFYILYSSVHSNLFLYAF